MSVPVPNKECVFPFKNAMTGKVHYSCGKLNKFCDDCYACGTKYETNFTSGWGLCNEACPREMATGKINFQCLRQILR